MKPISCMIVAGAIIVATPALARDRDRETVSIGVGCRDSAELTREVCFPYRPVDVDVKVTQGNAGSVRLTGQEVDKDSGCVKITLSAYGEHRLTAQSEGSFASREAKAHDKLQVSQCAATRGTAIINVQY